ncbi:hypothetical protein [Pseudomonas psychrophila]|uniref:hypothetical protein n=1 Tax=Pseudomonas psychrophila TaxID=122355 RepID=UPI0038029B8F
MEIVNNDRTYVWQLGNQEWLQSCDGTFSLNTVAGIKPAAELVDLDFLVGASPAPVGAPGNYLPAAFSICPTTGKALSKVVYQPTTRWLPPYGEGSGTRVINERSKLNAAEDISSRLYAQLLDTRQGDLNSRKQIIDLPRKNGLNFLVANLGGHREALYALSREGSLFLWQRGSGKWLELLPTGEPIGRSRLENWAWSVSLHQDENTQHLLLSSDSGATLISVDPLSLRYQTLRDDGGPLGGPGTLEGSSYLPQLKSNHVCIVYPASLYGWHRCLVEDADLERMTRLSAPILDAASRRLLWIGEYGYLSLTQGSELKAQWHPWPNNATAKPEQGPPFLDGRGLWQLIFDNDGQRYLQLDPGATDLPIPIKGYRLSTGHLSFKYNIRLELPWGEHDENIEPTTRDVVYPFIEFTTQKRLLSLRVKQSSTLEAFFESRQPMDVDYCFEQIGDQQFSIRARASEPWNAQWFFFDNAMWLYIDSCGALYRWNA